MELLVLVAVVWEARMGVLVGREVGAAVAAVVVVAARLRAGVLPSPGAVVLPSPREGVLQSPRVGVVPRPGVGVVPRPGVGVLPRPRVLLSPKVEVLLPSPKVAVVAAVVVEAAKVCPARRVGKPEEVAAGVVVVAAVTVGVWPRSKPAAGFGAKKAACKVGVADLAGSGADPWGLVAPPN